MAGIIFILGGARSGKSRYAVELAKKYKEGVAFIATCKPKDSEMKHRIHLHKKARPRDWQTFEEEKDIVSALTKIKDKFECIIIDCVTLMVSSFILGGFSQNLIEDKINNMIKHIKRNKAMVIMVSNEVGLGIVPENKLARGFRDAAGRINQIIAKESGEVYFMVSGIPWRIK